MAAGGLRAQFGPGARATAALLRTAPGVADEALAADLQGEFLRHGLVATRIRHLVEQAFAANRSFFRLLQGFLALGLVVGVAGLGVVMVRAVRERRRTVGVLRALGFPAGVVRRAFLIESSFVALEGILLGTGLSLVAYLYRTSKPAMRTMGFDTPAPRGRSAGADWGAQLRTMPLDAERPFVIVDDNPRALPECPQLKLLRMQGSVYFGAVAHVSEHLQALRSAPAPARHLLVMAKSMNFIDLAGEELWRAELRLRRAIGGDLYFHRPRPSVTDIWQRTGFIDELGRDHIYPDKRTAIAAIVPLLDAGICGRCTVKLFEECPR
jgi:hypothetical protein